ncbi:MAG TPA: c-type cytochrome [Burkholderiales bacterium]|nr:c-type cytochrome [Burkholderiales bacterium]
MQFPAATLLALCALLVPAAASAGTGEEVVKARCSLCHEGGAGGAPRIGNRSEWEPRAVRGKLALYGIALKGKPNTAMMARGGFRDLSNDEVMAAVDYMVARAGLTPGLQPEPPPPAAPPQPPPPAAEAAGVSAAAALAADADDRTVTVYVAEALCVLAPGSKVEMEEETASVRGVGIKVTTREGVVVLSGMVKNGDIIERAEAIAQVASRGRKIESKLIAAQLFEWD